MGERRRQEDEDRGRCAEHRRGPTSPTRWSRTAAPSTTSPTPPTRGRIGVQKESLVNGLYYSGLGAPGYYAAEGTDPAADLRGWRTAARAGRALRRRPPPRRSSTEITHQPLLVLHRPFDDSGAAADRRAASPTTCSRPTKRSASTTGPGPSTAEGTHRAVLRRLQGHPRANNKDDVIAAQQNRASSAWMARWVKGDDFKPRAGRHAVHGDLPRRRAVRRPVLRAELGQDRAGEVRFASNGREDDRARPAGDPAIAQKFNPVRRRRLCRPPTPPIRPALPATGSRRPATPASRCWARRR